MVTITDEKLVATADTVPAGYVLLTVMNDSKHSLGIGVLTMPGATKDSLAQLAAIPVPGDQFPTILLMATVTGGPGSVGPGQTAQTVVELGAGAWTIFSEGRQEPLFLTATETAVGPGAAPEAAVRLTEEDFRFTGLDGPIPTGRQSWKVVNAGKQPHLVVVGKIPAGATADQLPESLASGDAPPPPPPRRRRSPAPRSGSWAACSCSRPEPPSGRSSTSRPGATARSASSPTPNTAASRTPWRA